MSVTIIHLMRRDLLPHDGPDWTAVNGIGYTRFIYSSGISREYAESLLKTLQPKTPIRDGTEPHIYYIQAAE